VKKITRSFWLSILGLFFSEKNLWASGEGGGFSMDVIWQIIAFVLLAIFLVKVLKKPMLAFLIKRKEEIKNSLDQAKKKEMEAQRLLGEWEKKLEFMSREITELHQSIQLEGDAERRRIIDRAQEEGARIRKQAQVIAEQEVKKAQASLKKEMVNLSVELADNLLKKAIQPQDQERLVKEYIGKMKEIR
jgi:F-type H+-transporting ATPase subunit b